MQRTRVGVSRDFLGPNGTNVWGDIGLGELDAADVAWRYLDRATDELSPADIDGFDAVIFTGPAVSANTFAGAEDHPLLLARFGVGYDTVDLRACTAHDVAVTITPDGARRPVATAALTLMLAVLHNLVLKDRLVREGRWAEKSSWMGRGLTGRTVGLIGLGSTASDLARLLRPFQVRLLAYDPYKTVDEARAVAADLVDLDRLMAESDVVVVMAALTDQTRHLVDATRIGLMKPSAILVNVARGSIVDEQALVGALQQGRIAGAGLDVFEVEPPADDSPLLAMDQVVLSPHALSWTDEMSAGNGASAVRAVLDVLAGRTPEFVVNREVLSRPTFRRRLEQMRNAT